MISTNSTISFQPMPSGTGAPRHEVLEPRSDGYGLSAGVEVADPLAGLRHLAHCRQLRSRRAGKAAGHSIEGLWRSGEQELVVFSASRGPVERVATERPRDDLYRGLDRHPSDIDPRADAALLAEMAEIGRETVGKIDHRGHAARLGEPLPLARPRMRPQMGRCHVGACVTGTPAGAAVASRSARPAAERPRDPVTAIVSPGRAVDLRSGARTASPSKVTLTIQPAGDAAVSPPTTVTSCSVARA